jgi:hypothetical protein
VPVSIASFDIRGENKLWTYGSAANPPGRALVTINGIWNRADDERVLNENVADRMGFNRAWSVSNPTGYPLDFVQIAGHEIGAIDITASRAASAIECAHFQASQSAVPGQIPIVEVVAHSQGTMVFRRALSLLTSTVRASIRYQGFGGETYIDAGDWGLPFAENTRNTGDWVPLWAMARGLGGNQQWRVISTGRASAHPFIANYLDAVRTFNSP